MAEERDVKTPPAADGGSGGASSAPPAQEERRIHSAAADDDLIERWRKRIDEIDRQLLGLLNSRAACAVEIGRLKRQVGLPVYSPEREAWILDRVVRENTGPLDPLAVRHLFERVIDESRRLERLAAERGEKG
jgi:chorismate mutase